MPEHVLTSYFPYEYISNVGRLMNAQGAEIYLANRGDTEAWARAQILEAPDFGVQPNEVRFNSGDQAVPANSFRLIGWWPEPVEGELGLGLYWARIFTTSADLVPSMRFYGPEDLTGRTSVELDCAPGEFARFSPSNEPLRPMPPVGSLETVSAT